MATILHVTESLGGGVATALRALIRHSPQHRHFLLAAVREKDKVAHDWREDVEAVFTLPRAPWSALGAVRRSYAMVHPDWVHLHSSFGGAYGRLALLPRRKIIYTPHCYAFERRDLSGTKRAIFRILEQILATFGGHVAACSPREADLARRMIAPQRVVFVPNCAALGDSILAARAAYRPEARLRVAMIGRLAPQKDPDFFMKVAEICRSRAIPADFFWLGGGESADEDAMRAQGISVTGWATPDRIWNALAQTDVYFHCAAWEGCPMSLLEAAQLRLCVVARDIPALRDLPLTPTCATPEDVADTLALLVPRKGPSWDIHTALADQLNAAYSADAQRAALLTLYGQGQD